MQLKCMSRMMVGDIIERYGDSRIRLAMRMKKYQPERLGIVARDLDKGEIIEFDSWRDTKDIVRKMDIRDFKLIN